MYAFPLLSQKQNPVLMNVLLHHLVGKVVKDLFGLGNQKALFEK
jgi:hypothetical protein